MIQARYEQTKFDEILNRCMEHYYCGKGEIKNHTVFHYTFPDALNNILNRRYTFDTEAKEQKTIALRFTKADSLNDKAEGQVFFRIYRRICKKLEKKGLIDKIFLDFLESIENKEVFISEDGPFRFIKECDTYIFCLSEGKDLLPMWNYYSKNNQYEGYSLGFHFKDAEDLKILKLNGDGEINLYRVIYKETEIEMLLEDFLTGLYRQTDMNDQYETQAAARTVQLMLTKLKYLFKNEAFSHEREVRLVLHIVKNDSKYDIQFRTKSGILIPFIELHMERTHLTEITIGPLIEEKTARKNLEFFLQQIGYKIKTKGSDIEGIKINSSKVPIRY